jgi:hypothetical protein
MPDPRPLAFIDKDWMDKIFRIAAEADAKMEQQNAKVISKKRKDRIKLFDNCIKEYLNTECNTNYRLKYDR